MIFRDRMPLTGTSLDESQAEDRRERMMRLVGRRMVLVLWVLRDMFFLGGSQAAQRSIRPWKRRPPRRPQDPFVLVGPETAKRGLNHLPPRNSDFSLRSGGCPPSERRCRLCCRHSHVSRDTNIKFVLPRPGQSCYGIEKTVFSSKLWNSKLEAR